MREVRSDVHVSLQSTLGQDHARLDVGVAGTNGGDFAEELAAAEFESHEGIQSPVNQSADAVVVLACDFNRAEQVLKLFGADHHDALLFLVNFVAVKEELRGTELGDS